MTWRRMADVSVSLIIVSLQRPVCLLRAISAVRLQDHLALELIVVADARAADQVRALGLPIKLVVFNQANISAARNAGLAAAAGDLVAYLDDDAVPEPTWISRLAAPFSNPAVRAATGFVRARNGISDQWRATEVDQFGWDHALSVELDGVTLLAGTPARAVKALGTNCAFRRADLLALGGFDAGFRFYLDDADISLRIAALGGLAAIVPGAIVQHGFAASIRRRADRVPLGLEDVGASAAFFLRRHAPAADRRDQHMQQRHAQRLRLIRHMLDGGLEPWDIPRLLAGFDQGWADGLLRPLDPPRPLPDTSPGFLPLGTKQRRGVVLSGRLWQRRALMHLACEEATTGKIVTVVCLSPTSWYHHHRFDSAGFWIQQGGIYGRSIRDQAAIRLTRFTPRLAEEVARIGQTRPIGQDCLL